jgi:SAM-dependent methyltransferase
MPRDIYKDGQRVRLPDQSSYGRPNTGRYEYRARECVPLTDPSYRIDKGLFVYDEEPLVESGLDRDGPLFDRLGKMMLVGVEYAMRQLHLQRQIRAGSLVLDTACGYAELGKLLYTERYQCTYVGMDIQKAKLRHAISLRWGRSRVMFIQRDLSRPLPFIDDIFDVVVSSEFLEHIPKANGLEYLAEVHRVMKPGGRLILTTPNNRWGPIDPVHINEFSIPETIAMIEGTGLKVVEKYGLKLNAHIRDLDKQFKGDPLWAALRKVYPPIWAKMLYAAPRPEECVFWSAIAVKG